jgi:hypothetical protein
MTPAIAVTFPRVGGVAFLHIKHPAMFAMTYVMSLKTISCGDFSRYG